MSLLISEPVKAIIRATEARLTMRELDWKGPFKPPSESYLTAILFPGGGNLILQELEFNLKRNEPQQWPGLVASMLITARALAGLEIDAEVNRNLSLVLREALAPFIPAEE